MGDKRTAIPSLLRDVFLTNLLYKYVSPQSRTLPSNICPVEKIMHILDRLILMQSPAMRFSGADIGRLCSLSHVGQVSLRRLAMKATQFSLAGVLDAILETLGTAAVWGYGLYVNLALNSHRNHNFGAVLNVLHKRLRRPPPRHFVDLCTRYGSVGNVMLLLKHKRPTFRASPSTLQQVARLHRFSGKRQALVRLICKHIVDAGHSLDAQARLARYCFTVGTAACFETVKEAFALSWAVIWLPRDAANVCPGCDSVLQSKRTPARVVSNTSPGDG